jgi:hypothetical protein
MNKICFYILLILLILFSNFGLCQDVITMVYRPAEKAPYIEGVPSNRGLYQVIFKEAAKKIGMKFEIKRYPKKRAYLYLETGKADFYPGASFNPDREKIGYFIDNCMAPKGAMLLYSADIKIKSISEVKGYNLLYNMGGTTFFLKLIGVDLKSNMLRVVSKLGIAKAIKILQFKQSDFYAYDLTAVEEYFIKNKVVGIKKFPVLLNNQIDHLIFSKKPKYYKERPNTNYDPNKDRSINNLPYTLLESCIAYKFQQTIKSMHMSGEIERKYQKMLN